MVDATLIATFDPKIESFFPEGNFVTRWWVNGASVDFDPALEKPIESKCLAASVIIAEKLPFEVMAPVAPYYREVHFAINFLPERFGDLKKGDQVSVQMLFCLSGFGETNGLEDSFRFHDTSDSPPSSFSEISNRIDFTYSGDPQHPQQ